MTRIVLGSGSPRRRELLTQLGVVHEVVPADLDETPRAGESAIAYVERLAVEKAIAVAAALSSGDGDGDGDGDVVVVAADTTVELAGRILGKPLDRTDARAMLRALSGTVHRVHTGVAVHRAGRTECGSSTTEVEFVELTEDRITWYLATGEPFDKAGGYALQGAGGVFVERVNGSVSGVIGLPLTILVDLLARQGVTLDQPVVRPRPR
jgi:septum formation protein